MHWRRASTILAMLAALMVAPSSVSAANPNQLSAATVQPSTGTTSTTFVLSVTYTSGAGNAATSVTATVAGRTIPMTISSGTPLNGRWVATTTQLPVGAWPVTFEAVAKGQDPRISGGPITVIGDQPSPSGSVGSTPDIGSEPASPTSPAATAAPKPANTATPSSAQVAPTGGAQATAPASGTSPAAAPTHQGGAPPSGGNGGNGGNGGAEPPASAAGVPAPAVSATIPAESPVAGPGESGDQGLLDRFLLFGIVGVAAVALVGAAWIAATTRRGDPEASAATAAPAVDPALAAIPTVEKRAMRRARLRPSDDPILAALGLSDLDAPDEDLEGHLPRRGEGRDR